MNGSGTSRAPQPATPGPGLYNAMRPCTGGCGRRRSLGQFLGAGTVCKICRARAR